jgi:type I restriction enzyme S subunit
MTFPATWRSYKLGELAQYINGKAFKPDNWKTSGLPIVRIQNLTDRSKPFNYCDEQVESRYLINDGDLLISWSATLGSFIWDRGPAVLNQHIFKAIPNVDLVERDFLHFLMLETLDEMASRVEELESLTRRVQQEACHLPQAFRFDLWQDCQDRYPPVDLASVVNSTKNGLYKPREHHGSGALLLRMFNINGAEFDATRLERLKVTEKEASEYSINDNDIIVSRVNSRELVGKSTVVSGLQEVAVFEAMLVRLRICTFVARQDVLAWLMNSPQFLHNLRMRAKHAIGQSSINQQDLLSSRLPLPPLIEQEKIAEKFAGLGSSAAGLQAESTSRSRITDGLREAILRKAFAGEL